MSQTIMHAAWEAAHAAILFGIAYFALNCFLFALCIARRPEGSPMTATPTTPALSADTPESVSAKLREAARAQSSGFPHERPEWQAADFVEAQATEIARLSEENERLERIVSARDRQLTEEIAATNRLAASSLDAANRATRAEVALAASEERVRALREALENASRFVRAFAADETDEVIYASACACEEQIDAALSTGDALPTAQDGQQAPASAAVFEDRTGTTPICPACGNDQHDDWWHCISGDEQLLCGNLECACGAIFSITSHTPGRWTSHLPHAPATAAQPEGATDA